MNESRFAYAAKMIIIFTVALIVVSQLPIALSFEFNNGQPSVFNGTRFVVLRASGLAITMLIWRIERRRHLQDQAIDISANVLILIFMSAICFKSFLGIANALFSSNSMQEVALYDLIIESQYGMALLVWDVVFASPIIEEVFFRGILLSRLKTLMTKRRALVWSSVAFGFAHGFSLQAIIILPFSFLSGMLYLRSGRLETAIISHIAGNAAAFIIGLPLDNLLHLITNAVRTVNKLHAQIFVCALAAAVTLCVGSMCLFKLHKQLPTL